MKRLIDIIISLIILIITAPITILTAIFLIRSIGRPVFFIQKRPGKNEVPFNIIKFRSMSNQADENGEVLPDHMRMTKVGKFIRKTSIDELPQLINVLKGDLSIVGPRPLLMEYLPLYSERQRKRHLVKPGITGWAQVNGRNAISWEEKFNLDIWYVENKSFFLDMYIILLTVKNVLQRKDISSDDHVTIDKFSGNNR